MKKVFQLIIPFVLLVSILLVNVSCSPPPIKTSLIYQGQINSITPYERGYTTKATIITPDGYIALDSCSIYVFKDGFLAHIGKTERSIIDAWITEISENITGEYWLYQQEHSSLKYILSEKPILNWNISNPSENEEGK